MKLCASVFILLPLAGCAVSPKPNPTLCELAQNREAYAGVTVTVDGVLLASRHGALVVDPTCGMGIGLAGPPMPDFEALLERSQLQTMMVRLRVRGVVKQRMDPDWVGGRPWQLDLTKVQILEALPIAKVDEARFLKWRNGPSKEPFRPSR